MSKQQAEDLAYLEDFQVGQRLTTDTYTITDKEIKEFASKYDPQPFHLDEEAAKNSFFGELVASGWLTACIMMRLSVLCGRKIAGGRVGGGADIKWTKAVKPNDTLQVEAEVMDILPSRSHPNRGTLVINSRVLNQNKEVVLTCISKLSVPKRS